tara:strand:- start:176 stop:922 length:747 start_codon:yes stop_codon:yes gene_type:complete
MIAIISDIHSNFEVLKQFAKSRKTAGVKRTYCLGDVVGYGPDPNRCIDTLNKLKIQSVMGNHDYFSASDDSLRDFNLNALNSIVWTRATLSKKNRLWLQTLPYSLDFSVNKDVTLNFSHSNLTNFSKWTYIDNVDIAEEEMRNCSTKLNFIGHTHKPVAYKCYDNSCEELPLVEDESISLDSSSKWLINAGSLGQPRDGNNGGSYILYDESRHSIMLKRIRYDYMKTARKIIAQGLPEKNASRLSSGS